MLELNTCLRRRIELMQLKVNQLPIEYYKKQTLASSKEIMEKRNRQHMSVGMFSYFESRTYMS